MLRSLASLYRGDGIVCKSLDDVKLVIQKRMQAFAVAMGEESLPLPKAQGAPPQQELYRRRRHGGIRSGDKKEVPAEAQESILTDS